MSRAQLARRLEALEAQDVTESGPSPWATVFEEMSLDGLHDLEYIHAMAHPDPNHYTWGIIFAQPLGYAGPEWIASGPEAAHRYEHGWESQVPCRPRPGRQETGWPSYERPKDELNAQVWDVLLADAPTPEIFERWIKLVDLA